MATLSLSDLKALTAPPGGACLSIFLPIHHGDIQQDPIQLKNLLRQAEQRLLAMGLRRPEAAALLEPAQGLVLQHSFWQRQRAGLALFLAPEMFRDYQLPAGVEPVVVVGERFYIKPLLRLFSTDGRFLVLALSQNELRLLQCTRNDVSEVELPNAPSDLAEALRYDEFEKQLQFHTGTQAPGGAGERPAVYFSHGMRTDEAKTNLLRYFQQVDDGLREALGGNQAPLVLAGVNYLLPLYREASHYPNIVAEGIEGNPEELSAEELRARAWTIVQPLFEQKQKAAVERYHHLVGTGSAQASHDLETIVPAAYYGRVETLFVATDQQRWGTFDPATQAVDVHPEMETGDEDLLDLAAAHTLHNGGAVYAVDSGSVPDGAPLAAVFRY